MYEMLSGKCVVEGSRDDKEILKDLSHTNFEVDFSAVMNKFCK